MKEDVKKLKQDIEDTAAVKSIEQNLNVPDRSNSPEDYTFEHAFDVPMGGHSQPNFPPSPTRDQLDSQPSQPPSPTRSASSRQSPPSLPDLSEEDFRQPLHEPAKRRNIQIQPRQKRRRETLEEMPSIDGESIADDMQSEYACSLVILDDEAPARKKLRKSERIQAMKYQLRKVEEKQGCEWYCFEVRFHINGSKYYRTT